MKKFLTYFLLILIVVGGGLFYFHFYWPLGEGVKAGQLNYFNKKGYLFKTYEGKLIQAGFQGGGQAGSVQSNEFRFSVVNESVAQKLMTNSGKEFDLHYIEYQGSIMWRGTSEFIVDSIYSMRDAHGMITPFNQ